MEYSQIILNFMDNRDVTGYKLSKATGISMSLFSKWKKNPTSKIDTLTLTKIAEYFSVSTDYLLGKEDKKIHSSANETDERILRLIDKHGSAMEKLIKIYDSLPPEDQKRLVEFAKLQEAQQKLIADSQE